MDRKGSADLVVITFLFSGSSFLSIYLSGNYGLSHNQGGKAGNSKGQDGSTAIAIDRQLWWLETKAMSACLYVDRDSAY